MTVLRNARGAILLTLAVCCCTGVVTTAAAAPRERPRVILVTRPCVTLNFLCPPFLRALRRTGISGKVIAPDAREDVVATLSLVAKRGYGLIIVDINYVDALGEVAPKFPQAHFAILDVPLRYVPGQPSNVRATLIRTNEAAFLAGVLAARMDERDPGRDVVGAVGGLPIQPVDDFIVGYRAGARHASPHVRVLVDYSGDFSDPTKCEAVARRQIARGASVVFNVAGACGLGTLQAAKTSGVWGIGVDTDQSHLGRHILTSVVKHYDVEVARLLREVKAGRLRTGLTTSVTMRDGGAGLGRISPMVPQSIRDELDRVRARIVDGEIRVPGAPP